MNKEDLLGLTFGNLKVLSFDVEGSKKAQRSHWLCKCNCGNELSIARKALTQRNQTCCIKCRNKKHGMSNKGWKLLTRNVKFLHNPTRI